MYTTETRRLLSSNNYLRQAAIPYQNASASCKVRLPNKKYKLNEAGEMSTIGREVKAAKKKRTDTIKNPKATLVSQQLLV